MTTATRRPRHKTIITNELTLGAVEGEHDEFLIDAFHDNGDYNSMKSLADRRCFIIGRTGSGKSASFRYLKQNHQDRVITIVPENLSLTYLTNLDVVRKLTEVGLSLDPFLRALWKHVIIVELLRHRYGIDSALVQRSVLDQLYSLFRRNDARVRAISYLTRYGEGFWELFHERVRKVADSMDTTIMNSGDFGVKVNSLLEAKHASKQEQTMNEKNYVELVAKYERIITESQLPRLNELTSMLDQIIDESHHTYIVIDDLDKDWVSDKIAIVVIRSLCQAVDDLMRTRHLKILVALRTNIFRQFDLRAQRRGAQLEKITGKSLTLTWDRDDLRALLDHRAEVASAHFGIEPPLTIPWLLRVANKKSDALNYILDRTLMRPRDAIVFLNHCLREAAGNAYISWEHIDEAEEKYSRDRLTALHDEWKDPYLGLDRVLEQFREKSARLSRDQLSDILLNIAILVGNENDDEFNESQHLRTCCSYLLGNEPAGTWSQLFGPLVKLLYDISFLGVVNLERDGREEVTFSCHEPSAGEDLTPSDFARAVAFEVHPAFRKALELDAR